MRRLGGMAIGLLATVALLAIAPSAATAIGPITPLTVNEEASDAALTSAGESQEECISESAEGGCTLRAAVELANYESREDDIVVTIDVPAGTFGNTEEYGTFEVKVGARIVITGAGAGQTKIEGAGEEGTPLASIFTVDEGASLTIQKVTLLHGYAESGGHSGGAVYAAGGASVTIEDSALEENGADRDGGAVYGGDQDREGASITIKHSTVTNNYAEGFEEGGQGGGVYGEPGASITIEEESTIAHNTAANEGGGVSAGTGILVTDSECLDARGAKASKTHVKSDVEPDGGGSGGLIIKDSAVEENTAEGEGGGGVYVSQGEEVEYLCEELAHSSATGPKHATAASNNEGAIVIEKSTIAKNDAEYGSGGGIAAVNYGGCDESFTTGLTVKQSTITENTANGSDGDGGGIYAETEEGLCTGARSAHASKHHVGPAAAEIYYEESGLTVDQSTISHNRAGSDGGGYGGGVFEDVYYEDPIVNSTIADNSAGDDGGGVYAASEDVGALISDTLSDNTSEGNDGNNVAGGYSGTIELRNTILAEEPGEHEHNCEGAIESLVSGAGYNLDFPSTESSTPDACGLSTEDHDLVGVAPTLDPKGLQNNGGPTQTIALLSGSPAIGVVPLAEDCEEAEAGPDLVDQRGVVRPGIPGKGCDIGAYEYQESVATPAAPKKEEPKKEEPKKEVLSVKIVSPAQCASLRDITIHIQNVKQFGIVSAVVSIDGKHKRTLTGRRLTTAINLRGLPKGTFTIEIVARTRSGHTLRGKRVYHTCHNKLPGHSYLPL